MIKFYKKLFILMLLTISCSCRPSTENNVLRGDITENVSDVEMRYEIIAKLKTNLNGIAEKRNIFSSKVTGSEYRGQSRMNIYSNIFKTSEYIKFVSSEGVIKIRCIGVSDVFAWEKFYGGELKLNSGRTIEIVSNLGAAGKIIDNEKFISQKFLEGDKCFSKYGFQLISYEVLELPNANSSSQTN